MSKERDQGLTEQQKLPTILEAAEGPRWVGWNSGTARGGSQEIHSVSNALENTGLGIRSQVWE